MEVKSTKVMSQNKTDIDCDQCLVRNLTLFKNISPEDLGQAQNYRQKQVNIPARSVIFEEGVAHDYVYTLFSGWAMIYKTENDTDQRQILHFLLPGDFVGYQIDANGLPIHSCMTITRSVFCVYPANLLTAMLHDNHEMALRLLNMVAADNMLGQNQLLATGRKTAKNSVAYILMELFYRTRARTRLQGDGYSGQKTMDFPITQKDIGDAIGLTNVHVNRVIRALIDEKMICLHKRRLTILNEEKMCQLAGVNPRTFGFSRVIAVKNKLF